MQTAFMDSVLEEEATWQTVVLISKGGGDYRGIGILVMVCKMMAVILNHHFTASTAYHDSFHGFQAGRRTGTATLEVKLLQQVTSMR